MKIHRIGLTITLVSFVLIAFYFQHYVYLIKTKTTPEYYDLRQDQIEELSYRATAKQDIDAAERLASYYRFTQRDKANANKWDKFIEKHKVQK